MSRCATGEFGRIADDADDSLGFGPWTTHDEIWLRTAAKRGNCVSSQSRRITNKENNKDMASLYKKPIVVVDLKTGEKTKTKSKKWWGRYRDETGVERRVPLATDKTAAQAMLTELVRKMERKAAGIEDPFEKHRKRPLTEHVKAFEAYLAAKASSKDYVQGTISQITTIVGECKFDRIDNISASRVQKFLAELREKGKSISSSNHYLRAIKMFTRWLVRDRRTNDDRLVHLSKLNEDLDRRRIRRPLSMEEFSLLLDAAENGAEIQHVSGPDRVILYIIGAYTGYRRNEIGSVTKDSFEFDSDPPTLTVEAGYSKHRRTDVLPLRKDFADRIRTWIASKGCLLPGEPLIQISDKRTAEMLRKDLEAARMKWIKDAKNDQDRKQREKSSFLKDENDQGHVVDFHALRMTFITNLTRSGVSPKTAQVLARHCDINLTMNTYTILGVLDQAAAVEALPAIPSSLPLTEIQKACSTGTDGRVLATEKVPTVVPRGAEIGADQHASPSLRIAPNCTEQCNNRPAATVLENAKSPDKTRASRIAPRRTASNCTAKCERRDLNPHTFRYQILSLARLPIPPLSRNTKLNLAQQTTKRQTPFTLPLRHPRQYNREGDHHEQRGTSRHILSRPDRCCHWRFWGYWPCYRD